MLRQGQEQRNEVDFISYIISTSSMTKHMRDSSTGFAPSTKATKPRECPQVKSNLDEYKTSIEEAESTKEKASLYEENMEDQCKKAEVLHYGSEISFS